MAQDGTRTVTDPRPDWLRRCPPEELLTDEDLVLLGRLFLVLALLIVAGGLTAIWLLRFTRTR